MELDLLVVPTRVQGVEVGDAVDPEHDGFAVMGAAQRAGVLSIVGRASAKAAGRPFDEEADRARTAAIEAQIEAESHAFFVTASLRHSLSHTSTAMHFTPRSRNATTRALRLSQ